MNSYGNDSSDLHSKIAGLCKCIKDKVPYLTSTCDPFFKEPITQNIEYGQTLSSQIVVWLKNATSIIMNDTKLLRHELLSLEHSKPKYSNEIVTRPTLVMIHSDISSIVVQMVLWACISEECNTAIVDSLLGNNSTVTQQSTLPTKDQLQMWLRRLCFCVKKAVAQSFLTFSKMVDTSPLPCITSSILFESCIIGRIVKRTTQLFSIVGKVPETFHFLTSDPLHKTVMDVLQANETKHPGIMNDMVSLVSFSYQYHIQTCSEVPVQKSNSDLTNNAELAILPFVPYDVLSFMLKYKEIKSKWNEMVDLPSKDKPSNISSQMMTVGLDIIKPDLEKIYGLIKMKKLNPKIDERRRDAIVNKKAKELFSAEYLKENDLTEVQIIILHKCIESLLTSMKSNKEKLTIGENTLVNVLSTAINHVPDFLDNVESLFRNLGETLFKPDFTAYMIDVKFEIPVENDAVWQIYFPRLPRLDTFQSSNVKSNKRKKQLDPALTMKRKSRKERDSIAKEAIISTTVQAAKKTRPQKLTQTKKKKTAQIPTNLTQHRTQMVEQQGKGEEQEKEQMNRKVNVGNSSQINDHGRNETTSQVGGGQKGGRKHLRKIVKTGFVSPINVHHKRSSDTVVPPEVIRKKGTTSTLRRSPRKLPQPKEL